MKKIILLLWLSTVITALTNCKKDHLPTVARQLPPPVNTAPVADAGSDMKIELPINEASLNGNYLDKENNVKKVEWTKLSGPASCHIENNTALQTRIRELKEGVYHFELIVTDSMDMYDKDTVVVTVAKKGGTPANNTQEVIIGANEVTFTNLQWIFPWYPSLGIRNIHSYVSSTDSIKVLIQRDNAPGWVEAPFISSWPGYYYGPYEYFIEKRPDGAGMYTYGSLYIFYYGIDTHDTPDVKIVF